MRRAAIVGALVLSAVFAGSTFGQDKPGIPKEALGHLQNFVGRWKAEGQQGDDVFKAQVSHRLVQGKHCVLFNGVFDSTSEGISPGTGIIGWDASKNEIVQMEFWTSGYSHVYRLKIKSPTHWEGEAIGTDSEGNEVKQKMVQVDWKGADGFTWAGTGLSRGTESAPDYALSFTKADAKLPRAKPETANIPEEILASLKYYHGEWSFEWTEDEGTFAGKMVCRPAPGKHCTIGNLRTKTPDGMVRSTMVSGWNIHKKQVMDATFGNDGSCFMYCWTIKSPTLEEGTEIGVTSDGKAEKSKVRIEKKPDSYKWIETERTRGGESLPDLEIEVHRVKPKQES